MIIRRILHEFRYGPEKEITPIHKFNAQNAKPHFIHKVDGKVEFLFCTVNIYICHFYVHSDGTLLRTFFLRVIHI